MGGCRCTFRTCNRRSAAHPDTHFFHYPYKQRERCARWARNAGHPEYMQLVDSQLRNKVVCQEHFRPACFMNYLRKSLTKTAVPTLFQRHGRGGGGGTGTTVDVEAPDFEERATTTASGGGEEAAASPDGEEEASNDGVDEYTGDDLLLQSPSQQLEIAASAGNADDDDGLTLKDEAESTTGDETYHHQRHVVETGIFAATAAAAMGDDQIMDLGYEHLEPSLSIDLQQTLPSNAGAHDSEVVVCDGDDADGRFEICIDLTDTKPAKQRHQSAAEQPSHMPKILNGLPTKHSTSTTTPLKLTKVVLNGGAKRPRPSTPLLKPLVRPSSPAVVAARPPKTDPTPTAGASPAALDALHQQLHTARAEAAAAAAAQLAAESRLQLAQQTAASAAAATTAKLSAADAEAQRLRLLLCEAERQAAQLRQDRSELQSTVSALQRRQQQLQSTVDEQAQRLEQLALEAEAQEAEARSARDTNADQAGQLAQMSGQLDALNATHWNELQQQHEQLEQLQSERRELRARCERQAQQLEAAQLKLAAVQQQQAAAVTTAPAAPTAPAAAASAVVETSKLLPQLSKPQLFNAIRRYLNTSMNTLVRMEMFASAERDFKPDERQIAMDLWEMPVSTGGGGGGSGRASSAGSVYEYLVNEWRFRLPARGDVLRWMQERDANAAAALDDWDDC